MLLSYPNSSYSRSTPNLFALSSTPIGPNNFAEHRRGSNRDVAPSRHSSIAQRRSDNSALYKYATTNGLKYGYPSGTSSRVYRKRLAAHPVFIFDEAGEEPEYYRRGAYNPRTRPWQEVNEDISRQMIAASSDSPPIIPKRDYDESPNYSPQRPKPQQPISDASCEESDDASPARVAMEEQTAGAMVLYRGPPPDQGFLPPGFATMRPGHMMPYPGPFPGPMPGPWQPQCVPMGPPPPGFMPRPIGPAPPGEFNAGDPFGPYGPPMYPPPPPPPMPQYYDDDFLYRRKNKKKKGKKRSRSMEFPFPPPFFLPPPPPMGFGPPPGPPPPFLMNNGTLPRGPPQPQGQDAGPADQADSMALVPVSAGGNVGMVPGPGMYPPPPPFFPPPMPPMPMGPPMPVYMNGGPPMMNGGGPMMNGRMTPVATNGTVKSMKNGHFQNGTMPKQQSAAPAEKKKRHSTCYLICCRGHTQVLWIIIGIILVGVVLGLVLGLTLV